MPTLGIDLALQPGNTAVCATDWRDGGADVVGLARGADRLGWKLTDRWLLEAIAGDGYGQPPREDGHRGLGGLPDVADATHLRPGDQVC